jgi:hypothetical protein
MFFPFCFGEREEKVTLSDSKGRAVAAVVTGGRGGAVTGLATEKFNGEEKR